MESLLELAVDLERRDAAVARTLEEVERVQHDVDELRARASAAAEFLSALPGVLADRVADERAASEALAAAQRVQTEAQAALDRARRDDERVAAARAAQEAADDVRVADRGVAAARESRELLEREAVARRAEVAELEAQAVSIASRVRGVEDPRPGLDGLIDWAARARGALLLEHSALAGERETLVREATELLGSVTGEALASTSAAGIREKLGRALGEG